jgi:hypothetical protein
MFNLGVDLACTLCLQGQLRKGPPVKPLIFHWQFFRGRLDSQARLRRFCIHERHLEGSEMFHDAFFGLISGGAGRLALVWHKGPTSSGDAALFKVDLGIHMGQGSGLHRLVKAMLLLFVYRCTIYGLCFCRSRDMRQDTCFSEGSEDKTSGLIGRGAVHGRWGENMKYDMNPAWGEGVAQLRNT